MAIDANSNASLPVAVAIEVVLPPETQSLAVSDHFVVVEGIALNIATPGLLANDVDPDGRALTSLSPLIPGEHGAWSIFASGAFTYTPDPGFVGTDRFVYTAVDPKRPRPRC